MFFLNRLTNKKIDTKLVFFVLNLSHKFVLDLIVEVSSTDNKISTQSFSYLSNRIFQ